MTHEFLQNYWWLIMSVLGALLVFLLFVQGGQSMLITTKSEKRPLLINSLGRKWELTYTTLVTFGGAFFASFPLFYSTSFGGAYWLWIFILFSFVIQAIAYEYRTKHGNVYGTRFYDTLLLINGVVGPVLLGVAVAGMFFGAEFTVAKGKILDASIISQWGPQHGLEAIVSWKNLLFGFMVFFLARTLASLYFINNIDDEEVQKDQHKQLLINASIFVVLFLATVAVILTSRGVEINAKGSAAWKNYKYLHNYLHMWWALVILLIGVALVLYGIIKSLLNKTFRKGIWAAGIGTVLVVMTLFWVLGYNHTAYYPSLLDVQSSLTLANSSSSEFTLRTMSYVSLLVPFVVAYIAWVWRKMDSTKLTEEEIKQAGDDEIY
ncbi:MAG: cytochrome d ubiquinol oxidase subunit II [Muribaculaceae bacterium]|nr:cytochrome d ubiquinol oxidase subunit II [Muribaculaceae bacterium]MBR6432610.1 cytochrome d ubiquinol oxidase subunit II [Muribaculaceae bacterium]